MSFNIALPIRCGNRGYFNTTETPVDRARTNIINLILTTKGERFMHPTFGTNIRRKIFDNIGEIFASDIEEEIRDVVNEWLPDIGISNVQINRNDDRNAVDFIVTFFLKSAPDNKERVDFTVE